MVVGAGASLLITILSKSIWAALAEGCLVPVTTILTVWVPAASLSDL